MRRNFGRILQQQAQNCKTKKLGEHVLPMLYKKNILEQGAIGGKKGKTVLFLSMKVKMFG